MTDFTDLHDDLRAQAREVLAKSGTADGTEIPWDAVTQAGWTGLVAPIEYDGAGATFAEAAVVLDEIGRATAATALPTLLALTVPALTAVPADGFRDTLLRDTVAGRTLPVLVLDANSDTDPAFTLTPHRRLSGTAATVLDAPDADLLLVPARDDTGNRVLTAVAVSPGEGLSITPTPLVDATRSAASITAEDLAVQQVWTFPNPEELTLLRAAAAVMIACDALGSAEAMITATVDYVRVREQFGRPVGSFQAVKHACANMLVDVTVTRHLVAAAVTAITTGTPDPVIAAAKAKSHATEAAVRVAGSAMQLHGGFGYTWESGIHRHLKRATLNRALFGTPATHRRILAATYDSRP